MPAPILGLAYYAGKSYLKPTPTQSQEHMNEIMGRPKGAGAFYSNVGNPNVNAASDQLVDALTQAIETKTSQINTNMPGTIVSYDALSNRATVRATIPKRLHFNEPLEGPQIVQVPVEWPASGGGKSSLTMPLQPGDGVELHFQQRSIENWLDGNNNFPDDPRQFDLSDCIAVPGCAPNGIIGDPKDVVLKFNKTEVRITPENTIIIGNEKGGITIDEGGTMTLRAETIRVETPARSFTLELHTHSQGGDSGGDGEVETNPPTPS